MNRVFIVGNITGDIYFDYLKIKGVERPFLRLILMSDRPQRLEGMRVVLWDERAELYYGYVKRGSEIAVIGQIASRHFRGKLIHEIEAESLILLRNIDWDQGEAARTQQGLLTPGVDVNNVFLIGEVEDDIYFDWFKRTPEQGGGEYAFMRLLLNGHKYLTGLRVIVRGQLAELAYPYLQPGSKIALDGHIQTRDRETGKRMIEVTARNIIFLENINWSAGEAAKVHLVDRGDKDDRD